MIESLKDRAKRFLADVPAENVFRCVNGHILRNLKDLEIELKTISEQDFRYHMNEQKHDFSNWVKDIIKDNSLAKTLLKDTTPAQAAKDVTARVSDLSRLTSK